ncbi:MAG TPA: Spy/CpxP family protein refolding chaperone [Gemmatimonadales bacterium]|nr:Spy/CpxP family protein refolding chaperone [Gemmatimonadales bacterium]
MKALGLLTLALCCIAAPLTAQDTTHARRPGQRPRADDMTSMMHEMMGPMMRVMAYTPEHLLAHKDSLRLTNDQVTKLTAIQESAKAAHDAAASDMKTHMGALSQAFQAASPDTAQLRPHFDEAHQAMGKAHWAMLAAAARSRALLTDAQRAKVDAWVTAIEQREERRHSM